MAVLMASVFIGSCASTLDSALESNSAAFNASSLQNDASAADASTAEQTATATPVSVDSAETGDPQLPQQVAALPASTPKADRLPDQAKSDQAASGPQAGNAEKSEGGSVASVAEPTAKSEPEASQEQPEKPKSFLASFFGAKPAKPVEAKQAPAVQATEQMAAQSPAPAQFIENPAPKQVLENPAPVTEKNNRAIQLASLELPNTKPLRASAVAFADDGEGTGLPGVRQSALFEIKRRSGIDDDSDVDVHEDVGGGIEVASAAGMARLAPNGLLKQRESVDVACLKLSLVRVLKTVERRFGKKAIITSGYRSPTYNRSVRGARNSQHMYCAAADVIVPGVSKFELASFARSMPGRGGVGTYCHTNAVHIDVGPERDWNWRCRGRK